MVEYRNAPTQQRSRDTLDAIMKAADRLFYERGVDAATNKDIAKEAGVSIGSLYRFFPNKKTLVDEYVHRYMADLAEQIAMPLPETPNLDDLAQIVDTLIERGATVRQEFLGYSKVRAWRDPETGEVPAMVVREAEFALVGALFSSSVYDLDEKQVQRITTVLVMSVYPILELVPEVTKREAKALLAETKRMIRCYVTDRLADVPLKSTE